MNPLKKVDLELDSKLSDIRSIAENLEFSKVCEFRLRLECLNEIPWSSMEFSGVYLIEIKNNLQFNTFTRWVEDFRTKWEDHKYKGKFVPNPKNKRITKHIELKEYIPLYIGKSLRIANRVREHISLPLDKPTFALKLLAREDLQNQTFRISVIKIEVRNCNVILPVVESTLRERVNPIIGRQ